MNKINKIYYINLERRPDRNAHFLNECKNNDLPLEKVVRFNALDGLTYNFSEDEMKLFEKVCYKYHSSANKIMCNQLGHYYILKEMVEKEYNYIIILQDDVIFRDNFTDYIDRLLENIPLDAEIINIGFHKWAFLSHFVKWDFDSDSDYDKIGKIKINNDICLLQDRVNPCSLAYLVTLNGAKKLVDYFSTNGFSRETDHEYNDYLRYRNIFYGSNTVLCTGNANLGSDIF
jgi:GR25 family glycosyltransferase involved in LPS biosynthesis